jgi:hypothetical protein
MPATAEPLNPETSQPKERVILGLSPPSDVAAVRSGKNGIAKNMSYAQGKPELPKETELIMIQSTVDGLDKEYGAASLGNRERLYKDGSSSSVQHRESSMRQRNARSQKRPTLNGGKLGLVSGKRTNGNQEGTRYAQDA